MNKMFRTGCPTKTRLVKNAGLFAFCLLLASCSEEKKPEPVASEKVLIRGSNTIGEELAPKLIAEYKRDHPGADFNIESKATVYGIAALLGGQCDIAAASRETLKEEVELAKMRDIELNNYVIGAYSVAVVANASSPVANLTKDQVRDIFAGAVTNWKDVGGPEAPIHLYIRDPISGTYLGFKELAMGNKSYADNPKMFTSYEAIVKAVAQDAHGIGYSSLSAAKNSSVKSVAVGGVLPTLETINKGQYPYARILRFYTNKGKEARPAKEFIQFVTSERGQKIVAQMGFAPHQ